jgi:methionyl-tRNA formyltransferase
MGTPEFAAVSLRTLLDAGHNVVAVVTQPDRPRGRGKALGAPPVKELAVERGIPVVQPEKIRTPEFEAWLRDSGAHYAIVVAYGRILPPNILALPPGGCINVHASLLPRWRGASPIQWSIVQGDAETGVTTMLMDAGLDTGPMLAQRTIPIGPDEDAASLQERLAVLGGEVLLDTLDGLADGRITPVPQPSAGVTYAPLLDKERGAIDWSASAQAIHNQVRGLFPWPGAYTHLDGLYLKVLRTQLLPPVAGGPAHEETEEATVGDAEQTGQIINISKDGADVATGTGILRLLEVQPAGKRRMDAGEFFRNLRAGADAPALRLHTLPLDIPS